VLGLSDELIMAGDMTSVGNTWAMPSSGDRLPRNRAELKGFTAGQA